MFSTSQSLLRRSVLKRGQRAVPESRPIRKSNSLVMNGLKSDSKFLLHILTPSTYKVVSSFSVSVTLNLPLGSDSASGITSVFPVLSPL